MDPPNILYGGTMAEKEDKFIVVKKKDFEELEAKAIENFASQHPQRSKTILKRITGFKDILRELDKGNKYIVINRDEPYADAMWDIIIAFENMK